MSDCEHTCYRCWLAEKKEVLEAWLFHHMPLGWRHRRVMRAAMRMRHHWQTAGPYRFLVDPRYAHRTRRLLRGITQSIGMRQFPRYVVQHPPEVGQELTPEILDEALQKMYDSTGPRLQPEGEVGHDRS